MHETGLFTLLGMYIRDGTKGPVWAFLCDFDYCILKLFLA